jgi:hypothetical protein
MESPDQENRKANRRRGLRWAGAGLLLLVAGMALGGYARSTLWTVLPVTAGYVGLVLSLRRALLLWNTDSPGFEAAETGRVHLPARSRPSRAGRVGAFRLPG